MPNGMMTATIAIPNRREATPLKMLFNRKWLIATKVIPANALPRNDAMPIWVWLNSGDATLSELALADGDEKGLFCFEIVDICMFLVFKVAKLFRLPSIHGKCRCVTEKFSELFKRGIYLVFMGFSAASRCHEEFENDWCQPSVRGFRILAAKRFAAHKFLDVA